MEIAHIHLAKKENVLFFLLVTLDIVHKCQDYQTILCFP